VPPGPYLWASVRLHDGQQVQYRNQPGLGNHQDRRAAHGLNPGLLTVGVTGKDGSFPVTP
jgi:hypothetical protein